MTDRPQPITIEQVEQFLENCVSTEEAAWMLKVSTSHFRALVADGTAPQPVKHLGTKSVKYPREEIEALAERRSAEKAAAAVNRVSRIRVSA